MENTDWFFWGVGEDIRDLESRNSASRTRVEGTAYYKGKALQFQELWIKNFLS